MYFVPCIIYWVCRQFYWSFGGFRMNTTGFLSLRLPPQFIWWSVANSGIYLVIVGSIIKTVLLSKIFLLDFSLQEKSALFSLGDFLQTGKTLNLRNGWPKQLSSETQETLKTWHLVPRYLQTIYPLLGVLVTWAYFLCPGVPPATLVLCVTTLQSFWVIKGI